MTTMAAAKAGRPELPVDRTVPACAELADFLRARKDAHGHTYRQMAHLAGGTPSAATFERAATGTIVGAWETVETFVEVTATKEEFFTGELGRAVTRARQLWLCARRATRAPYYVHTAPDPELIVKKPDFALALRDQHIWGGCPTPGEMERAAGIGVLPSTTARRIIKGRALPVTPEQALAFLHACNAEVTSLQHWLEAAARVGLKHPDIWTDACDRYTFGGEMYIISEIEEIEGVAVDSLRPRDESSELTTQLENAA
ncbi:hypothetical protein [Streptomyces sp. NPDC021224]|uniref:hypothetical protein n=1 Tax=unclassified Streptomyces TaxID=2593676 RepID=UPI0037ABBC4B